MLFVKKICELDENLIKGEFSNLKTSDVVLTSERDEHIRNHHPSDYKLYSSHLSEIIEEPDYILKDEKNEATVIFIKHIENANVNIIIKLALETDEGDDKNSIITFYRLRKKNLEKLVNREKVIYKAKS